MPIYETPDDRQIQQRIISLVCARWNVTAFPTPRELLWCYDYALVRFDPITLEATGKAIAEVKSRAAWTYGDRETCVLSERKWIALTEAGATRKVMALMIIHDKSDGLVRYVEVRPEYVVRKVFDWGRSDRPDDPNARETGVVIPVERFKIIGKLDMETKAWPN